MSKLLPIKTNFLTLKFGATSANLFKYKIPKKKFTKPSNKTTIWGTEFVKSQLNGVDEVCNSFASVPTIDSLISGNPKTFFRSNFKAGIYKVESKKNPNVGSLSIIITMTLYDFNDENQENLRLIFLTNKYYGTEDNYYFQKIKYTNNGNSIKFPIIVPMIAYDLYAKGNDGNIPTNIISEFNAYVYSI